MGSHHASHRCVEHNALPSSPFNRAKEPKTTFRDLVLARTEFTYSHRCLNPAGVKIVLVNVLFKNKSAGSMNIITGNIHLNDPRQQDFATAQIMPTPDC